MYVDENARRKGVGKSLLQALIAESELHGIWTLQAGIFPENVASIALHKSCGFRKVGIRRRIGKLGRPGETRFCWSGEAREWAAFSVAVGRPASPGRDSRAGCRYMAVILRGSSRSLL